MATGGSVAPRVGAWNAVGEIGPVSSYPELLSSLCELKVELMSGCRLREVSENETGDATASPVLYHLVGM